MAAGNVHDRMMNFWSALPRAGCLAPRRQHLDPTVFPDVLPYLALVDFAPDGAALKYRLVGTAVAASLGQDPTGQHLQPGTGLEGDLYRWTRQVMQDGNMASGTSQLAPAATIDFTTATVPNTRQSRCTVADSDTIALLVLPFSNDRDEIDLVMAAFDLPDLAGQVWYRAFAPNGRVAGQARRLAGL